MSVRFKMWIYDLDIFSYWKYFSELFISVIYTRRCVVHIKYAMNYDAVDHLF